MDRFVPRDDAKRRQERIPRAYEIAGRLIPQRRNRDDGKERERCPLLVQFPFLVPCVGTPKTDWVGRGGRAAGRGSARKGWLNG